MKKDIFVEEEITLNRALYVKIFRLLEKLSQLKKRDINEHNLNVLCVSLIKDLKNCKGVELKDIEKEKEKQTKLF